MRGCVPNRKGAVLFVYFRQEAHYARKTCTSHWETIRLMIDISRKKATIISTNRDFSENENEDPVRCFEKRLDREVGKKCGNLKLQIRGKEKAPEK